MTTKVKVTREVAEAIEALRKEGRSNYNIIRQAEGAMVTPVYLTIRRWAFDTSGAGSPDLLIEAPVNGYEVEKTPEDELRGYMRNAAISADSSGIGESFRMYERGKRAGVFKALELLGIKIGGINA